MISSENRNIEKIISSSLSYAKDLYHLKNKPVFVFMILSCEEDWVVLRVCAQQNDFLKSIRSEMEFFAELFYSDSDSITQYSMSFLETRIVSVLQSCKVPDENIFFNNMAIDVLNQNIIWAVEAVKCILSVDLINQTKLVRDEKAREKRIQGYISPRGNSSTPFQAKASLLGNSRWYKEQLFHYRRELDPLRTINHFDLSFRSVGVPLESSSHVNMFNNEENSLLKIQRLIANVNYQSNVVQIEKAFYWAGHYGLSLESVENILTPQNRANSISAYIRGLLSPPFFLLHEKIRIANDLIEKEPSLDLELIIQACARYPYMKGLQEIISAIEQKESKRDDKNEILKKLAGTLMETMAQVGWVPVNFSELPSEDLNRILAGLKKGRFIKEPTKIYEKIDEVLRAREHLKPSCEIDIYHAPIWELFIKDEHSHGDFFRECLYEHPPQNIGEFIYRLGCHGISYESLQSLRRPLQIVKFSVEMINRYICGLLEPSDQFEYKLHIAANLIRDKSGLDLSTFSLKCQETLLSSLDQKNKAVLTIISIITARMSSPEDKNPAAVSRQQHSDSEILEEAFLEYLEPLFIYLDGRSRGGDSTVHPWQSIAVLTPQQQSILYETLNKCRNDYRIGLKNIFSHISDPEIKIALLADLQSMRAKDLELSQPDLVARLETEALLSSPQALPAGALSLALFGGSQAISTEALPTPIVGEADAENLHVRF